MGMIFQKPNPLSHLSVFENVACGLRLHGLTRGQVLKERVETCLRKAAFWEEVKDNLNRPGAAALRWPAAAVYCQGAGCGAGSFFDGRAMRFVGPD